jgi:hypothetical protein
MVQHLPQSFHPVLAEGSVYLSGARGTGAQGFKAAPVELVDGIAHGLLCAAEIFGYPGRALAL